MAKKATKTVALAMQERNERRATEMMTRAEKMIRNAQDLINTLAHLVSENKEAVQPESKAEAALRSLRQKQHSRLSFMW